MPLFKIRHITKYTYDTPVRDSANQIVLYPVKDNFQDVLHHQILISGNPEVAIFRDYFENDVGTFTHPQPHKELLIDSRLEVVTKPRIFQENPLPADAQWKSLANLNFDINFIDFIYQEPFDSFSEVENIIREGNHEKNPPLQAALDFTAYIYNNFRYQKGITSVETTPDEIWKIKSGVCQDFAHILLVMLRILKIPARYVSGYICPNKSGMRGEGATHAWVEAYLPGLDWVGLDPTNNCIANDTHVRLAVGKNFTDCSPVRGTYRGTANHTLEVTVLVEYEDGHTGSDQNEVLHPTGEPLTSYSKNSFRRFQEMQMQQ